jgi:hypothetical protein
MDKSGTRRTFGAAGLVLLASLLVSVPAGAAASGPSLTVDAAADHHTISPDIYGMNFADQALATELHLTVDRWGGNSTSRYNWQNNTYNTGSDYFFENIPPNAGGTGAPGLIAKDRAVGMRTLLTVPMLGWVAKDSPQNHPYACGFKVSKYGPQGATDPWDPDCGNGVFPGTPPVNDPTDTSIAADPATWDGAWATHNVATYGKASGRGVKFYELDNEPSLWSSTHKDVHPVKLSDDELTNRSIPTAIAIKAADSTAQVMGPSEWGYLAYLQSAVGDESGTHGGLNYAQWYLKQMAVASTQSGHRLLDFLDEHYYPQNPGVALSPAGTRDIQAMRLRSTRSLWDPTYTDESWQSYLGPLKAIPRLRSWIATYDPGTKLSFTEYNWGGLEAINGALAQADVLGIFGRQRVSLATLWAPPTTGQPGAFAFRMFRNYDGAGRTYGDLWCRSSSTDQGMLSVYSATRRSDGALTVMVINKTGAAISSKLSIAHFIPGAPAARYEYSGANTGAIVHDADVTIQPSGTDVAYPANSITLLVIPH